MPSSAARAATRAANGSEAALLASVDRLVEEQLWPRSAEVDLGSALPIEHFDAIAGLGLYGMVVPTTDGGLGLSPPTVRAVLRALASGCGVTAFAFAQHHGTIGAVAGTDNVALRQRWLDGLAKDRLAGIAYAHVRRRGTPVLSAEPDGDGWLLHGAAPWVTSWGLAEVMGVAANTADGRLLWSLVPAAEGAGLTVSKSFDLMAYRATQTVALTFDRVRVPADAVLSVVDFADWNLRDRLLAARPNPLCIGVGDRALAELTVVAPDTAAEFASWWVEVADRAEAQCRLVDRATSSRDALGPDEVSVEAMAATRAETVLAAQRLTTALLSAVGGRAMEAGHPAQRLAREVLFYVIQAQSGDGRDELLKQVAPNHAE